MLKKLFLLAVCVALIHDISFCSPVPEDRNELENEDSSEDCYDDNTYQDSDEKKERDVNKIKQFDEEKSKFDKSLNHEIDDKEKLKTLDRKSFIEITNETSKNVEDTSKKSFIRPEVHIPSTTKSSSNDHYEKFKDSNKLLKKQPRPDTEHNDQRTEDVVEDNHKSTNLTCTSNHEVSKSANMSYEHPKSCKSHEIVSSKVMKEKILDKPDHSNRRLNSNEETQGIKRCPNKSVEAKDNKCPFQNDSNEDADDENTQDTLYQTFGSSSNERISSKSSKESLEIVQLGELNLDLNTSSEESRKEKTENSVKKFEGQKLKEDKKARSKNSENDSEEEDVKNKSNESNESNSSSCKEQSDKNQDVTNQIDNKSSNKSNQKTSEEFEDISTTPRIKPSSKDHSKTFMNNVDDSREQKDNGTSNNANKQNVVDTKQGSSNETRTTSRTTESSKEEFEGPKYKEDNKYKTKDSDKVDNNYSQFSGMDYTKQIKVNEKHRSSNSTSDSESSKKLSKTKKDMVDGKRGSSNEKTLSKSSKNISKANKNLKESTLSKSSKNMSKSTKNMKDENLGSSKKQNNSKSIKISKPYKNVLIEKQRSSNERSSSKSTKGVTKTEKDTKRIFENEGLNKSDLTSNAEGSDKWKDILRHKNNDSEQTNSKNQKTTTSEVQKKDDRSKEIEDGNSFFNQQYKYLQNIVDKLGLPINRNASKSNNKASKEKDSSTTHSRSSAESLDSNKQENGMIVKLKHPWSNRNVYFIPHMDDDHDDNVTTQDQDKILNKLSNKINYSKNASKTSLEEADEDIGDEPLQESVSIFYKTSNFDPDAHTPYKTEMFKMSEKSKELATIHPNDQFYIEITSGKPSRLRKATDPVSKERKLILDNDKMDNIVGWLKTYKIQ